ncbi:energy-coupling factor transporter ATPase [Babesia caballi]|uniref:Energy-coupling factor transporter ATPase n=1 Tax=Babesia caballi TaxID=5871 RepID=A0AAV4M336_BABCB|nr:energy-coupling factor transporter ATPase [Babesia caballi]
MPHARKIKAKVVNSITTSEVLVSYEIDGSLFERRYREELFSSLSQVFWTRSFKAEPYVEPKKDIVSAKQPINSIFSRMTDALQSIWSFGFSQDAPQLQDTFAEPGSRVDLSDAVTYNRIALSHDWRRHKDRKVLCVSFENTDLRWNGIYLHRAKIPISRSCSKFTICHAEHGNDSKHVMVVALIGDIWVESFYTVHHIKSNSYVLPSTGSNILEDYTDLPSRRTPTASRRGADGIVLDVSTPPSGEVPFEVYEFNKNKYFRYKDGQESDEHRMSYVKKVKFGQIEYPLPSGHTFVMMAVSNEFLGLHYVILVTRTDFYYSINKWCGMSMKELAPVSIAEPEVVAGIISDIYGFFANRGHSDRIPADMLSQAAVNGDVICLPPAESNGKSANKACKPLNQLAHTEILVDRAGVTILKYKGGAPPGILIVGDVFMELGRDNGDGDTNIYIERTAGRPISVAVKAQDGSVRALVETREGSNTFVKAVDSMVELPHYGRTVDVNISISNHSSDTGINWEYYALEGVWVLRPSSHPAHAIGNVIFHNCRVLPPKNGGYSFVVAPTNEEPETAVLFAATPKDPMFAVQLKRTVANRQRWCSVELLKHQPKPMGNQEAEIASFATLFPKSDD